MDIGFIYTWTPQDTWIHRCLHDGSICDSCKMVSCRHISFNVVILMIILAFYLDSCRCSQVLRKFAQANNEMALKIFQQLAEEEKNVFFSPLSLSSVFAMLHHGARGKTAKEIGDSLGYKTMDFTKSDVEEAFIMLLPELSDVDAYVFNYFNTMLLNKKFDLDPAYKKDIQKVYNATVEHIDFKHEQEKAMEKINGWVKETTHGKIEKLLDELDPETVLVLLNAVYFKGSWKKRFDHKNTREETFYQHGIKDNKKKVPMMKNSATVLPYAKFSNFEVFELAYKGGNLSMIVLLPESKDGLQEVVKELTLPKMNDIRMKLEKTKVDLTMPKFDLEYDKDMSNVFQELGMKSVFHQGANFSGITKDDGVFVSQVKHKAAIEVNEEGTEAAAATAVTFIRASASLEPRIKIVVNHPFLFSVLDKRYNIMLFVGSVTQL